MKRKKISTVILCGLVAATGCGDDTMNTGGSGGSGAIAGTGGAGGVGGTGGPGTPALAALPEAPSFAVISSDFSSSSIAVLDADFIPIDESWLNSGTTFPGLVATLSGDAVLPNRQAGDGTFAVIDRFNTDVVSRFFVPSGDLDGQVRTQGELGMVGFSSNPQDLVFVDDTSAWVTRLGVNLDANASPENQGNDLLQINPMTMELTGGRIDLSPLDTMVTVMMESGPVDEIVYARPNRAVRVESTLVVGLDRSTSSFVAGPGMVAVVDLDDDSVVGLLLDEGLANCGNATPVPDAPTRVIVSCVGFAEIFGDEAETRASAGVVLLAVDDGEVTIEMVWRASSDDDSAIAVNELIAIDENRVVGVALGDFVETTDRLYLTHLDTGEQELIHESAGSFEIGTAAYDPDAELLFVPDGIENAVIEYALDENGATEVGTIQLAPALGLPPRKVYRLD